MKPKMQLSADCPVTPQFRIEINAWMLEFFGSVEDAPQKTNDANLVVRKPKKKRGAQTKTLDDLLNNIAVTFKNLEFDIDDVTFHRMLKKEVVGLKKCSPLVTDTRFLNDEAWMDTVDSSKPLPTYFVVAVNRGDKTDADTLAPDFAFGMRVNKVPWNVTRMTGAIYLFGMAWRDGKKHIWNGFWLSVQKDGSITVADELQTEYVTVGRESYHRRKWDTSSWHGPEKNRAAAIRHCFAQTLTRYQTRAENWNIGVSNGKKRITFLVPDNEAKDYFRNRNKVVNENGKTRPIIHYVKAHSYELSGKTVNVPEHIRGLREFDWQGYRCTITAPKFHAYSAVDFEFAGEEYISDDLPEGFLGIGELADRLNDLEDSKQKRKARAALAPG